VFGRRPRRVSIARSALIGTGAVVGAPSEQSLRKSEQPRPTSVGPRTILQNYVILGEGSVVGMGVCIEDRARLGYSCIVHDDARVMYGAYVCDRVEIGTRARVAGFVCDCAILEADATSMGFLVHEYANPLADWWGPDEPAPRICTEAVVGMGALVVGGITVGCRSYVAAGSVVTRDVPPDTIVTGVNHFTAFDAWRGSRLRAHIDRYRDRSTSESS